MQIQDTSPNPFIAIPQRKINEAVEDIKNVYFNCKTGKLSVEGGYLLDAIQRYYEANIPADYWFREMDKFEGSKELVKVYKSIIDNIKDSYKEGKSFCLASSHGLGKMIALDTELPTPNGFVQLKDLKKGDELFDENGNVCKILQLHPVSESPESYRVTFDDGTYVDACADHLWLTYTKANRKEKTPPTIKTTKDILNTIKIYGKNNHSIPCVKPIKYYKKKLLIDPYVLGCWLGDGTAQNGNIECAEQEILDNIIKKGYSITKINRIENKSKSCSYRVGELIRDDKGIKIGKLRSQLKELNLLKNKHIPDIYLKASFKQRLELLQGLMDTDGYCYKHGIMEFSNTSPILAYQVYELISSLGIKTSIKITKTYCNGKRCKDQYRLYFSTSLPAFKLTRKLNAIKKITKKSRSKHRFIVDISPIKPVPMRCITVDSPSHLYLVTRAYIPTHNTMTSACVLKRVVENGYSALYVNLVDIVNLLASPSIDGLKKEEARKMLLSVDFLVIDEFDTRFMGSENAADLFGRIVEPTLRSRIQNSLPTIICTNSTDPTASFSGPLKASFKSLMNKVKFVPVLGTDFRSKGVK